VPALPSSLIEPLWDQFAALIPPRVDTHPLGCHRPRIGDRIVFDKLIQVLVLGATYDRIADASCSATTLRTRRDEWISDGLFAELEDICLRAYDQIVGLDLGDVTVDGCIVKAPCGGEAAGKSPVDRGKLGTKRSLLVDSTGVPLGCVVAPANRHDSPLLRPTLEKLARFDEGLGVGLPDQITVHLDAGYDSTKTRDLLEELGCHGVISVKGFPLQAGARWVVERTKGLICR
jgi:transposase